jgi:hypothetical protein
LHDSRAGPHRVTAASSRRHPGADLLLPNPEGFSAGAIEWWRAERRTGRGGQAKYSDLAIATFLTLRAVFRLALRQTEGLIGSILQLLGLDLAVPDHSTLSRRTEMLEVPWPCCGHEPVHLLVDSTGLRLCGPGG